MQNTSHDRRQQQDDRRRHLQRASDRVAAAVAAQGFVAQGDLVSIEMIVESNQTDAEKVANIRRVLELSLPMVERRPGCQIINGKSFETERGTTI